MPRKPAQSNPAAVAVLRKTSEWFSWIGELKRRYRATQIKAAVSVNASLLEFYWDLGRDISERYPGKKRDAGFFQALSADLKLAIPGAKGLSPTNIKYTRYFYELYSGLGYRQQLVDDNRKTVSHRQQPADDTHAALAVPGAASQCSPGSVADLLVRVPWGHHIAIIDKCRGDVAQALFYVRKTVENGWSRSVLAVEIDGDLYARQGKAVSNFSRTLPDPDGDLAQQLTKDPYVFEVQGLAEKYRETELTEAMCDNIVELLKAMGRGFAFVGREHVVEVDGKEYRIDLLFYCIPLHRYFAVEVKTDEFESSYLGQLQGYVAACDLVLNSPQENPAIGLLVCRGKNAPLAKYLLGKIDMPIGVSDYELMRSVPDGFKSQLPTVEEIEAELANMEKREGLPSSRPARAKKPRKERATK